MNVLILGSGGREHTFAWKLAQSPLLNKLYIAPGNAGTATLGKNIKIKPDDFTAVKSLCIDKEINMVVVGPEDPLVKGIHDFFLADVDLKNIPVIGPQKAAAELEGSKDFAKEFLFRHNIPTAAYKTFTSKNLEEGYRFLETLKAPYVLKADGLAAGKGVIICQTIEDAKEIEENSNQILDFTREVKNLPEQDKIKIVEALWSIIYSNKDADIYETNLMRRLAGLLYIDNKTMGDIKEKIKQNLE